MDQLRIPTLALDHVARLRAEAERDRQVTSSTGPSRPALERLSSWLAPRRSGSRSLAAKPC